MQKKKKKVVVVDHNACTAWQIDLLSLKPHPVIQSLIPTEP